MEDSIHSTMRMKASMTLVQAFLQEYGLKALTEKYGIVAKPGLLYPNLYSLKYNMIESPMDEQIVLECRGIVVDSADNWKVVARPFDKFFNIGESRAAEIDWETATVFEKLDGSLMIMYFYDGAWQVASSGVPDASGPVNSPSPFQNFRELFWTAYDSLYPKLSSELQDWTFMFELMTPWNRIVVPHKGYKLSLIGVRNRVTGQEVHLQDLHSVLGDNTTCFKRFAVKSLPFRTYDEMVAAVPDMDPLKEEGFVICDANFNRVKLKTPAYVAMAHMKDSFNLKSAVEIVRQGETSEFGAYFPAYKEVLDKIKEKYDRLVEELERTYEEIKGIENQKEFALQAVHSPVPDCLFALRKGKVSSVTEYFETCRLERLTDILASEELAE